MKLSVGSDPEIFLRDKANNLVSAIGKLGGTKLEPRKTKHGWVQEDGVAAEFNSTPSSDLSSFISNHNLVLDDMRELLSPLGLQLDLNSSSAFFEDSELEDPLSRISGCLPDYDAWSFSENETANLFDTNLRAAGGHLHIAFEGASDIQSRIAFTKVLDMHLGVPSVLLDTDKDRRELYGKAGAHRPKFKDKDGFDGIEYRVLSNYWIRSNSYMKFVFNKIQDCNSNWKSYIKLAEPLGQQIQTIINTGDPIKAKLFCDNNKVALYG